MRPRGKHAALSMLTASRFPKSSPYRHCTAKNCAEIINPGFRFNGLISRQRGANFFTVTTQ